METILGQQLCARTRLHICTYLLIGMLAAVSGERTLDKLIDTDTVDTRDFRRLWDVYILPRLELDLSTKYGKENELMNEEAPNYTDFPGKQTD